ncbi:hypothetical protein D3C76_1592110 [compost metagenome]
MLHAGLHLGLGEVTVAIVHCFELAAVDGDDRLREQIEVTTENHELTADAANGFTVVLAKVGDGFEIRGQASREPHQLDIAFNFTLKPAAGLNTV